VALQSFAAKKGNSRQSQNEIHNRTIYYAGIFSSLKGFDQSSAKSIEGAPGMQGDCSGTHSSTSSSAVARIIVPAQ
jgi:hypothetical protein